MKVRISVVAALVLVASPVVSAVGPKPSIKTLDISTDAPPVNTPVTLVAHGQNTGDAKSAVTPLTVLTCEYRRSAYKDPKGVWSTLPSIGDCTQVRADVSLPEMAPGAEIPLPLGTVVPHATCPSAIVVKYGAGKNDFLDPAIAKYTLLYPVGLHQLGNPTLAVTHSFAPPAKGSTERMVTIGYTMTLDTSPAATRVISVEQCHDERCFVKATQPMPSSAFTTQRSKHVASGSFQAKLDVAHNDYYGGSPNLVRVSYGEPRTGNTIAEARCDPNNATVKTFALQ